MGLMRDLAEERSQILKARQKRDRGDTPCASVSSEQCDADLLRKLYGYAAELRGEIVKEEDWQESPEWVDDPLATYLGIDLDDSVDIDDLGVGFSRLDLLELRKREAAGLQVRIHSLAGGYFSSVAPLDPSTSPVSQLPVSCRQLCELDEDGYRAFRTNLSRLMLEVFSEEKLLEPEGCTRDIKSEILAWCKQKKSRIIGGPGSLESAEKYFKMFEKIRPNCETNEGAYDKIDSILDQDVKFNGREHNQSTVIRYIKEYKAAIEDLGF
jgi:hypothetical protein